MTVHFVPLPLELDVDCPIHVPWPAKPPQTEARPSAEDQLREYVQRRYWETLYLPEVRTNQSDDAVLMRRL
jgi:hypothetical protein